MGKRKADAAAGLKFVSDNGKAAIGQIQFTESMNGVTPANRQLVQDRLNTLDSSGITCLVRARAMLGRDERTLGLVCPPGSARRVLDLVGIDQLVALYASRDEVARALSCSAEGG